MPTIHVERLTFQFPLGWKVTKFDDWNFYRNRFLKIRNGLKAVDLLAVSPEHTAFFIEVKDYRQRTRQKTISVLDEFQEKILCTLSALLPAQCNATDPDEQAFARLVASSMKIRAVLHVEQSSSSRLFAPSTDLADMKQKVRGRLKPIDPHPMVVNQDAMKGLHHLWSVV